MHNKRVQQALLGGWVNHAREIKLLAASEGAGLARTNIVQPSWMWTSVMETLLQYNITPPPVRAAVYIHITTQNYIYMHI